MKDSEFLREFVSRLQRAGRREVSCSGDGRIASTSFSACDAIAVTLQMLGLEKNATLPVRADNDKIGMTICIPDEQAAEIDGQSSVPVFQPGPWESYADEENHYSYVRNLCALEGDAYEALRVTHFKDRMTAEFVHQVFYMHDFAEEDLNKILLDFGYEGLEGFVKETNLEDSDQSGFVYRGDGTIDKAASPAWYIDFALLTSLLAEHVEGMQMDCTRANALANRILGKNG